MHRDTPNGLGFRSEAGSVLRDLVQLTLEIRGHRKSQIIQRASMGLVCIVRLGMKSDARENR